MKQYRNLFFDLDNTLIDFRANAREAFAEISQHQEIKGQMPDIDAFLQIFELVNEELWVEYRKGKINKEELRNTRFVKAFNKIGIENDSLADKVSNLYMKIAPEKTNMFNSTHETLSYLAAKYPLYLITNGFLKTQMIKLNSCGLEKYFKKLFIAELTGFKKPDKRFFEYAISSLHAHKNECLMIGDDQEADIEGAKNAGIDQVFFNPDNKEVKIIPTYEIKNLAELIQML